MKSNFSDWCLSECEILYCGNYSFCYRKGKYVRKYFNFGDTGNIKFEFYAHKTMHDAGIRTAKPLFFSYDKENDKWYIQSLYCKFSPLKIKYLEYGMFRKIGDFIDFMQSVSLENFDIRNFNFIYDDLFDVLELYAEKYKENIEFEKSVILNIDSKVFVHGDFLIKNLGLKENELIVFDFQNSSLGPKSWDISYFLSEFDLGKISDDVKSEINLEILTLVKIILKIRIGRAIRKNLSAEYLEKCLSSWEKLIL